MPSTASLSHNAAEHPDDASWRSLLDRIVAETRQRWPGVHDLAQELHYRTFDQSLLEEIRAEAYREATEHIRALAAGPGDPERAQHIQALVDCSQPLKTAERDARFTERFRGAVPLAGWSSKRPATRLCSPAA